MTGATFEESLRRIERLVADAVGGLF